MNKQIKVFAKNKVSSIDAQFLLRSWTEKEKNSAKEWQYKGRIRIAITDGSKAGEKNKYAYGFIEKSVMKVICRTIINDKFKEVYPKGKQVYGGSRDKQTGQDRARVISITFDETKKSYSIKIEEGPAKRNDTGGYIKLSTDKSAYKVLGYEEALVFFGEILDVIVNSEQESFREDKPLNTFFEGPRIQEEETEFFEHEPAESEPVKEKEIEVEKLSNPELKALYDKVSVPGYENTDFKIRVFKELKKRIDENHSRG